MVITIHSRGIMTVGPIVTNGPIYEGRKGMVSMGGVDLPLVVGSIHPVTTVDIAGSKRTIGIFDQK